MIGYLPTYKESFGSRSAWIRIGWLSWVRIRIRIENVNPDPDTGAWKLTKINK
jgi:hypothetical protein